MTTIKLNIDLATAKAGDIIEMEPGIAQQFIVKGWATEADKAEKPTPVVKSAPAKKERHVIGNIHKQKAK